MEIFIDMLLITGALTLATAPIAIGFLIKKGIDKLTAKR